MKIALLFPSVSEMAFFAGQVSPVPAEKLCGLSCSRATYRGLSLALCICGVGKVNAAMAAQSMICTEKPDALLLCGVAGGIRKGLHIGDTVLGEAVAHHDVDPDIIAKDNGYGSAWFSCDPSLRAAFEEMLATTTPEGQVSFGRIVTGEQFIDQNGRDEIIKKYDPDCVDMETAAIAQVCKANQLPFFAVRSITDTQEESGLHTFRENLTLSSARAAKVLLAGLDILAQQA